MADDFEVDLVASPARVIFDATAAKLRFESDVFWARASIGEEMLQLWLKTYQTSRDLRKRYCGAEVNVIQTEKQMLLAQQSVANLGRILLEARKVHSQRDYLRLAEPILLEVQQREQEIFQYLSAGAEQLRAS
jgi:hypothetical protein